jgi:putative superfamily III holin-X
MAFEQLKNATLPRALSDVAADVADLLQKELRLAQAEIAARLSRKLSGSAWLAAAGALGMVAALLVIEAIVFGIASTGIALHWSCLIVAAALAAAGVLAFYKGRADANEALTPSRTIRQLKQDVATAKEQLS